MEDIYTQLDDAFDKLWEECGCPHADKKKKDKAKAVMSNNNSPAGTTNVVGNLKRREFNKLSNDKKADMAKEVIEPAKGE